METMRIECKFALRLKELYNVFLKQIVWRIRPEFTTDTLIVTFILKILYRLKYLHSVLQFTLGGFDELLDVTKKARTRAGLSPSFEEQSFENFGHSPEFYLRASSPQREKEERKKRSEVSSQNNEKEIEKDVVSEDDTSSYMRNNIQLRPKVR